MKQFRLPYIISAVIGLVFLVSAVSKILTLDSFEIYVYSFGLFNLNLSFILARLLIGVELVLGLALLLSVYRKPVGLFSISLLTAFTLFLLYLLLCGETEHCHCFGDVLPLSHGASILKNLVLIGGLIYLFRFSVPECRMHRILFPILILAGFSVPFIISPPDTFLPPRLIEDAYNPELLEAYISQHPSLSKGRKMLCFMGTGCRFCKLSSKKISVIAQKANSNEKVFYTVWGNEESVNHFFEETHSTRFPYSLMEGGAFLRIINGKMPLILLLENGKIKTNYSYRSINDQEMINFLENK